MEHQYLDAVLDTLPATLRNDLQNLSTEQRTTTDTLLRFVLGGPCSTDAPDALRHEWLERQSAATQALQRLRTQTNGKRAREDEGDGEGAQEAKRARASQGDAEEDRGEADEGEDKPLFTLHALSVTAPLRKKLDIRIHQRSLRLLNPNTQAVEQSIPLSALRRAFLLPTRGKTRAHWTVLLMSADTPTTTGKGTAKDKEKDKAEKDVQLVFGVDAAPGAYSTTDHTATDSAPAQHARGTPVLPFLRAFLAHVPVPLREPDAAVFRSATAADAQGAPLAGVQAYRAAKEGTLWFFDDGILWDGRPAEFWPCADLVGSANAAGEAGTGSDGVRLVSATGRTCSVFVRRRVGEAKGADGEDGDEEDVECVETDFNMVDGREQDGISTWVRRHKHLFGRPPPEPQADEGYGVVNGKVDLKGKGKAVAPPAEDSEDEDDSDFVDEDDSDGGSATSDSEEGSGDDDDAEGDDGEDEEDDEDDEDDEEGDEEVEELDPAKHPLLRPGAMPKMSKAAMDAAVGMVMGDFVGGSGAGKGKAAQPQSDEEDELDD